MTRERPWWASDGPVEGGLDTSEDPVERIRHARRGGGDDRTERGFAGGEPSGGDAAADETALPFTDEPGVDDAPGSGGGPTRDARADDPRGGIGAGRDLPPAGPWWEAAAETVSRLARDLAETAEAHDAGAGEEADDRRASGAAWEAPPTRGGVAAGAQDGGPGAQDDDPGAQDGDPVAGDRAAPGGAQDGHRVDACGICPICVGLRTLGESRPELVGHLAEAARHVALAARSLASRSTTGVPDDEPFQHIGLDD